jgi:quercetin dioxygenase-like cupin family protein
MDDQSPKPLERILDIEKLVRFSDERATVRVISVTKKSSIAVWGVRPGQEVPAHTHPDGQDTWIMVRGKLTYYLGNGEKRTIAAGQIDIAEESQIHGAINEEKDDAVFLSIYSAPSLTVIPAVP